MSRRWRSGALEGRLPWIDAEDDDRNRSSDGIAREIVLSPRLREDFGRAFGPGRLDPEARPGLARWAERLHAAADRTVTCSQCSGSYFCDRDRCSWCDAPRPSFVMARVLLWDPERRHAGDGGGREGAPGILRGPTARQRVVDMVAISAGEPVELTERVTHGTSGRTPRLRIGFAEDRITLEPLDGEEWRLVSPDGRGKTPDRKAAGRPGDRGLARGMAGPRRSRGSASSRHPLRPPAGESSMNALSRVISKARAARAAAIAQAAGSHR